MVDVLAALILVLLSAPFVGCAALVLLLSGQSPFYGHVRVGRDGVRFRCWKLTTMRRDADQILAETLSSSPQAAQEWRETRKLRDDPRITRLGRFLRVFSIDELPQLWNVLRGEMSLVGPRPITQPELQAYGDLAPAYLRMVPGITGLWQVNGRNRLSFQQRMEYDVIYAVRHSPAMDLSILMRTLRVVLSGSGG